MLVTIQRRETVAGASQAVADEFDQLVASIQAGWGVEHNVDGTHKYTAVALAGMELPGVIKAYAGSSAPTGYLVCDGAEYSPLTYPSLFGAIGTTWNTGGETPGFFRVPDGRKRALMGAATAFAVGATGGTFDHAHAGPAHTHTVADHAHAGSAITVDAEAAHVHTVITTTDAPSATTNVSAGSDVAVGSGTHTHGINDSTGTTTHTHTASAAATGSAGAGNTGSSGTGDTGSANGPYFVGLWIIKY